MSDPSFNWRDESARLFELQPAQVAASSARHVRFVIGSMQVHIQRLEDELKRHEEAMARLQRAVQQTDVLSTASMAELYRSASAIVESPAGEAGPEAEVSNELDGPMC